MKTVMLFGTFDILHTGHVNKLWQAQKHGDYIIAVVARDATVKKVKGKKPKHGEKARVARIRQSGLVNKTVLGSLKDRFAAIKKYKPNVIALGYDQESPSNLKEKLKELGLKTKIVRLKPYKPHIYKTSKILKIK